MPLIRVPPGTIPREPPRDTLRQLYDKQEAEMALERLKNLREAESGRVGQFSRRIAPKEERENIDRYTEDVKRTSASADFSGARPSGYWGKDSAWQQLSRYEKAAAMALLEADVREGRPDFAAARNALGAMINRADKEGQDLGEHVSRRIYQPTIEPAQYARLQAITRSAEFKALTGLAEARDSGQVDDWVGGATHFLAKPDVMLQLEAEEPEKYKSWRKWTGYDESTGRYSNEVLADSSHVFLAPEGKHTADRGSLSAYPDDPGGLTEFPSGKPPPMQKQPDLMSKLGDLFGKGAGSHKLSKNPIPYEPEPPPGVALGGLPEQEQGVFTLPQRPQRAAPRPQILGQLLGDPQRRFGGR